MVDSVLGSNDGSTLGSSEIVGARTGLADGATDGFVGFKLGAEDGRLGL